MHLLVTGGAGYIGSVVVKRLIASGHTITVLDSLATGTKSVLPAKVKFVHADLADINTLLRCLEGKDAVLHFAASISVAESMANPTLYFQNNVTKTIGLLEAMLSAGVRKFIFSSTAALYGQPETVPVTEEHPLRPLNPYGESKLMVERVLEWLHECQGLRYASLRYFNAAGGTVPKRAAVNLIPVILAVARGEKPYLEVFGTSLPTRDGTAIRDYIHVNDLATAHLLALNALETRDKMIYNLGTENGATVYEVLTAARNVTGRTIPIQICPKRAGDPAEMIASSKKIRKELGWNPITSDLETIIRSSWQASEYST